MDLNSLSPYIRVALDYTVPPNWALRERVIFDYELLFVKEGEIIITLDGKDSLLVPGDFFLIKPRHTHSMRLAGDVLLRHPHIHFDFFYRGDSRDVPVCFRPLNELSPADLAWFREDVCSGPSFFVPEHIKIRKPAIAEEMLMEIINEFEIKPPYYEQNCKGIFLQLWSYLLREIHTQNDVQLNRNSDILNQAMVYLRMNLDKRVSIDALAHESGFSTPYFISLFKKAYGTTPSKFQQLLRVNKAKQLIQFTSIPITAIAEMCGFDSIQSFSMTFKKVDGTYPSFYRKQR